MTAGLARRLLPFLNWPRVDAKTLTQDLLAGLAVSLLAIPQSLAYAQLAGVPAYYGSARRRCWPPGRRLSRRC
jgi:MFS superfamily sulfate permease-like transporter